MDKLFGFLVLALMLWIFWTTTRKGAGIKRESSARTTEVSVGSDAWEGSFVSDASDPRPLRVHLQFSYTDGDGNQTTRSVRVREFDAGSDRGLLIGHCELRQATRTFRQDRIRDCVNLETGELVSDPRKFLLSVYESAPERKLEQFENNENEILDIIAFVARADGAVRKGERSLIAEYCRKHVSDLGVTSDQLVEVVLRGEVMTIGQFRLRVGKVCRERSPNEQRELLELARAIVATQKTIHPAEQEAVNYLEKKLQITD